MAGRFRCTEMAAVTIVSELSIIDDGLPWLSLLTGRLGMCVNYRHHLNLVDFIFALNEGLDNRNCATELINGNRTCAMIPVVDLEYMRLCPGRHSNFDERLDISLREILTAAWMNKINMFRCWTGDSVLQRNVSNSAKQRRIESDCRAEGGLEQAKDDVLILR
ncbi:hypothetical protein BLNAU_16106 [Blattamonas nauphoetae]|uniref:Uncharacterized protein n=1 Tax=Blattamonas nauphoetae TaxID=2049346 RepID=A0ABQ9XFN5_9EUKA|nr:hypothetical protein BLNAU_16106 [Blattamonas nauphoetae]